MCSLFYAIKSVINAEEDGVTIFIGNIGNLEI